MSLMYMPQTQEKEESISGRNYPSSFLITKIPSVWEILTPHYNPQRRLEEQWILMTV